MGARPLYFKSGNYGNSKRISPTQLQKLFAATPLKQVKLLKYWGLIDKSLKGASVKWLESNCFGVYNNHSLIYFINLPKNMRLEDRYAEQ